MKTLGLIPARAGSKGIPGKNKRRFNGLQLYALAVRIGLDTCEEVVVSTDDADIMEDIAGSHAYVLPRPMNLAGDQVPMLAVVQHALAKVPAEIVVLLQPTQPLRTKLHVLTALRMLEETGGDSVVSVVQLPAHYSPDYAVRINSAGFIREWDEVPPVLTRRQDTRPAYSRDGTVYAIKRETIQAGSLYGSHCVPLIIPPHESCNLDTEDDWARAESMVP